MSVVHVHLHSYTFEQIKLGGAALINDSLHQHSFVLIQQWLNGAELFTFHTSGSTGAPKPIQLQRSQLLASAQGTIEALGLTSQEHVLVCMNTQFIGGAMLLIRALMLNAEITLMEPNSHPLSLIETNHPFTLASFAPLQVFPLMSNQHQEHEKLNRFNHILVGGAPIDVALEDLLASLSTRIYHTYGMTETVSHIALKQLGTNPYYTVLNQVQIKTDAQHCLMICCEATNNQWIQTKDVVELHNTKQFSILGRLDDVINSGGIKIWPQQIEVAIRTVLGSNITNVCVLGMPDVQLGQKVVALLEGNTQIDTEALKKALSKNLTRYQIPKHFYSLKAFLYTPTGKIDKTKTLGMLYL
jgi:O-succinylbenzoic acid--CoA ligase